MNSRLTRLVIVRDLTLGADVHTIQELTNILLLDQAGLVDERGRAGGQIDVRTFHDDLILGVRGLADLGVAQRVNGTHDLLTQEVADQDLLATVGDLGVDREVRVHQAHVVAVGVGHAGDHVVDVRADSAQGRQLLQQTEVQRDFDFLTTVDLLDRQRQVAEVTLQRTLRALNRDNAGRIFFGAGCSLPLPCQLYARSRRPATKLEFAP